MRERIDILTLSADTITTAGDTVPGWTVAATGVPARMDPRKSSELVRAMREVSENRYICTIRHRDGLTGTGHRVTWRGRTFDVEGITNPDERRGFLQLDLREIAP